MSPLWVWLAAAFDRLLCRMGLHRWSHPGGQCESCGVLDK